MGAYQIEESAIIDAQQALKLDAQLSLAQRLLGKVYRQQGQPQAATIT